MRTRWDDETEIRPLVTRGPLPDETPARPERRSAVPLFVVAAILLSAYLIMKAVDSGVIIVMR